MMFNAADSISVSDFHPMSNSQVLSSEKTHMMPLLGPQSLDSDRNLMIHPSWQIDMHSLYPSNCPVFWERRTAQMFSSPKLVDAQLTKIAINKLLNTDGVKWNPSFVFNDGITHSIQSPMRITPWQTDPIEYEMHDPDCLAAHRINDQVIGCIPKQRSSNGNQYVLISSVSPSKASRFWPAQEDRTYRWDTKRSNLQRVTPNNPLTSIRNASSSSNSKGKLSQTGKNSSQHFLQRYSMNTNPNGNLAGIYNTLPRKCDTFNQRNTNSMSLSAQKNCNVWENKHSSKVARKSQVDGNKINGGVNSKTASEKLLVQRFSSVLYPNSHTNILDDKYDDKKRSNVKTDPFTTLIYPETKFERSFIRFQSPNCRSNWRYEPERWALVSAFCHSLESMCQKNSPTGEASKSSTNTRVNTPCVLDVPLSEYLRRIASLFECPKECFVTALEYIHRLVRVKSDVVVNFTTVHQLTAAALRVSQKFLDDNCIRSSYYAYIVDLPVNTISVFEAQLLFFLKFDLIVRPDQYNERYWTMLANNRGLRKVTIRPGSI